MNAAEMARRAYCGPAAPARTARDTEYDLFARITHRLRATLSDDSGDPAPLAHALHDNRRLWTALAADAALASNELPPKLRAQIVYLCEFTRIHTHKVLEGSARAQVLVDINTAVMRGLRSNPGAAT